MLTGITPSGSPHLGNYIGAIRPAIKLLNNNNDEYIAYFFIADYHSLIKIDNKKLREKYIYEVAATWMALGINPEKIIFYRQSDIPEIMELNWILNSITPKSLINRAHAYKKSIDININKKNNKDLGIKMGLFNYPILMAADIIMFNPDFIPVGKDQIQHVEITRKLVKKFNTIYKCNLLKEPKALVDNQNKVIPGLDGRKMSKSYNNTIPIFASSTELKKLIMNIKTNSQLRKESKFTENCTIFLLYNYFATPHESKNLFQLYNTGIEWSQAKNILFEKLNTIISPMREKYEYFLNNKSLIDHHLKLGAKKARFESKMFLNKIKETIGL